MAGSGYRVFLPVSDRPIAHGVDDIGNWVNREAVPLLKQLSDPGRAVLQGNNILGNLDMFGAGTVRYNVRLSPNTGAAGATETCALYIRTNHGATWDVEDRFNGGIYFEVDQYQFLAGNGATKSIHRGWGDCHFVALMAIGDEVPITDVSNTTPMVVTTSRPHGFGHNNTYQITGVTGNTAANKEAWYGGRVTSTTTLELYNDDGSPSTGSGLYTGGGQITCINSQVGYEAACFSDRFGGLATADTIGRADGAVGFLSSVQGGFMPSTLTHGVDMWESGMGRNKLFEALVENDQLYSGGCFVASDTPNRAFVAIKRQYFRDNTGIPTGSGIGGFAMMSMEEAYYNPQNNDGSATAAMPRWQLFNDASMRFDSLLATSGTTTRDAPIVKQFGAYWDGAASVTYGGNLYFAVTGAGTGRYALLFGRPGFEAAKFYFQSDGVFNVQGGDITSCDTITLVNGGSYIDFQGGDIVALGNLTFSGANTLDLQGTELVACGGITFQNGKVLDMQESDIAFSATNGGNIAQSNAQKIGFWGATPIVQPSSTGETTGFTAGGGAAVDDQGTWTGNVGASAYTVNDIVKHLKNAGLIAA